MSYRNVGLMDDMVAIPAVTGVSGGCITGNRYSSLTGTGEMDLRGNNGNTKVADMQLLRAYCAARSNTGEINHLLPAGVRFAFDESILNRFRKWIKRFHIWVAHAWLRTNEINTVRCLNGRPHNGALFTRNEKRIIEWINHLHDTPTGECEDCCGSGLTTIPEGDFLWSYCSCERGKTRNNCWKNKKGWNIAELSFTE